MVRLGIETLYVSEARTLESNTDVERMCYALL